MRYILWILLGLGFNPAGATVIDPQQLAGHVRILSAENMAGRRNGTVGSARAQSYIESVYDQHQLIPFKDNYRHPFRFGSFLSERQGVNIVGWIKGTAKPAEYIVISAHYDHLGSKGTKIFYGADDNASGVAAMMVLAKLVSADPLRHSVIFLATDAEEAGLHGAKAFIGNPPVPLDEIRLNLNLDMLGIGDRRNRLYIGGGRGNDILSRAIDRIETVAPFRVKAGYPRQPRGFSTGRRIDYRNASDHGAFARQGIDFLFITGGDHPYYHTEKDSYERLNIDLLYQATVAIWSLLRHVDNLMHQK